eukprot:ctg_2594.g580
MAQRRSASPVQVAAQRCRGGAQIARDGNSLAVARVRELPETQREPHTGKRPAIRCGQTAAAAEIRSCACTTGTVQRERCPGRCPLLRALLIGAVCEACSEEAHLGSSWSMSSPAPLMPTAVTATEPEPPSSTAAFPSPASSSRHLRAAAAVPRAAQPHLLQLCGGARVQLHRNRLGAGGGLAIRTADVGERVRRYYQFRDVGAAQRLPGGASQRHPGGVHFRGRPAARHRQRPHLLHGAVQQVVPGGVSGLSVLLSGAVSGADAHRRHERRAAGHATQPHAGFHAAPAAAVVAECLSAVWRIHDVRRADDRIRVLSDAAGQRQGAQAAREPEDDRPDAVDVLRGVVDGVSGGGHAAGTAADCVWSGVPVLVLPEEQFRDCFLHLLDIQPEPDMLGVLLLRVRAADVASVAGVVRVFHSQLRDRLRRVVCVLRQAGRQGVYRQRLAVFAVDFRATQPGDVLQVCVGSEHLLVGVHGHLVERPRLVHQPLAADHVLGVDDMARGCVVVSVFDGVLAGALGAAARCRTEAGATMAAERPAAEGETEGEEAAEDEAEREVAIQQRIADITAAALNAGGKEGDGLAGMSPGAPGGPALNGTKAAAPSSSSEPSDDNLAARASMDRGASLSGGEPASFLESIQTYVAETARSARPQEAHHRQRSSGEAGNDLVDGAAVSVSDANAGGAERRAIATVVGGGPAAPAPRIRQGPGGRGRLVSGSGPRLAHLHSGPQRQRQDHHLQHADRRAASIRRRCLGVRPLGAARNAPHSPADRSVSAARHSVAVPDRARAHLPLCDAQGHPAARAHGRGGAPAGASGSVARGRQVRVAVLRRHATAAVGGAGAGGRSAGGVSGRADDRHGSGDAAGGVGYDRGRQARPGHPAHHALDGGGGRARRPHRDHVSWKAVGVGLADAPEEQVRHRVSPDGDVQRGHWRGAHQRPTGTAAVCVAAAADGGRRGAGRERRRGEQQRGVRGPVRVSGRARRRTGRARFRGEWHLVGERVYQSVPYERGRAAGGCRRRGQSLAPLAAAVVLLAPEQVERRQRVCVATDRGRYDVKERLYGVYFGGARSRRTRDGRRERASPGGLSLGFL